MEDSEMLFRRPVILAVLLAVSVQWSCAAPAADQPAPKIEVYFSPHGGCTDAIVKCLDGAKETVLVQAYYFTSSRIAKALLEAHQRGVNVQIILDKSQRTETYSEANFFRNGGIPTFIDDKHAIAHNKVMVVDGRIVITGSFNFDVAAEEDNAENLLVIHDTEVAEKYAANWKAHLAHSVPYEREHPPEKQESPPVEPPRHGL